MVCPNCPVRGLNFSIDRSACLQHELKRSLLSRQPQLGRARAHSCLLQRGRERVSESKGKTKTMELSMSGNALKTFARSITCLGRIGNELVLQASPSQLALHTLNSSRSAYQSVTYKSCFFDVYRVSGAQAQCSVLLKALCSVFRTPIASIDQLVVHLSDVYASKVQWTLECSNGMKKTYWITCNVEPDIQHLSLDRTRFPSNFVIRPRDMNRLLANFQSSLQEITIIATEPIDSPSDVASEIGGKAVELRSYIDPTKESDSSLYTQLWIDPAEEFVQYSHNGDPVDVTFSVKELKAFLTFCEGCEIDIHLFFQKSGEPILMAPRFGLDDGSNSNFDATLVLATMLTSQLHGGNPSESVQVAGAGNGQTMNSRGSRSQQEKCRPSASEHPSDHTRIWSDLSGSAVKISGAVEERQGQRQGNLNASEERNIQRIRSMHITKDAPTRQNGTAGPTIYQPMAKDRVEEGQDKSPRRGEKFSQHHPSNWVDPNDDDEDDDNNDMEENELCVQSTPPYYEE